MISFVIEIAISSNHSSKRYGNNYLHSDAICSASQLRASAVSRCYTGMLHNGL